MKLSTALGRMTGRLGVVLRIPLAIFLLAIPISQLSAQDYRISTGDDYGAVIDTEGNLFVWGAITAGGVGGLEQVPGTWREVSVSRTAAAEAHILLIASNGSLWSFGLNDRGQLGVGDQLDRSEPTLISPASNWVEVAAGAKHSLARNAAGEVYAWGDNTFGQLNADPIYNNPASDIVRSLPSLSIDGNTYISIAAGNDHSHAIRSDGTLWAWGSGGDQDSGTGYELGILINGSHPVGPLQLTRVGTQDGWTRLFGGFRATFALRDTLTQSGQLWVWGSGANLGTGSSIEKTPKRVGSGTDWTFVSHSTLTNAGHALALKSDGTLWGWGSNWPYGQLGLPLVEGGIPQEQNRLLSSPTLLEDPNDFLAIGVGDGFSAVIDDEGFMLTAGRNDAGQLANGSIDATPSDGQEFFDNSELGVADLVALSVTVNEQLVDVAAGNTISVSFQIQNAGTGIITEDFELEARLNTLPTFGGEALTFAVGLPSFLVTDDFAAGQSRSIDVEIELPTDISQGTYYIVMRADSNDDIIENSETNNDAASENTFSFLPDLVVPSAPNGLVVTSAPGDAVYDAGTADTIDIDLEIENIGNGTLPAGSTFNVRLFLSPDRSTTNSAIVELVVEDPIVLAADLEAAPSVNSTITIPFSFDVPFMPAGSYFVGVELDIDEEIAEQPELLNDNDVIVQVDGETNNSAFTDGLIVISGLGIAEAVDQDGVLTFDTDGDGEWFGQTAFFNANATDPLNDDAARSPALAVGESASFRTSFATPVAISFDWSADTSNQDNRLEFRVVNGTTGGNNNSISGDTDGWIEDVTRVIPLNAQAEWVYFQGAEGVGDAVFVDDLQFTEITEPDLVIDDIYLPGDSTGSFVLQRDRLDLTVNSRNQGTSTTSGEEYVISIYLSPDPVFDRPDADPLTPDDILIRQVTVDEVIEGGDPAVNGVSINLDTGIDPGFYYVIGYIDDYTDGSGALLPGKTIGTGEIDEFVSIVGSDPFPGEDNNTFVSELALVEIVALPDIEGTSLSVAPSYYFINDPATDYLEPNDLPFNFTVSNEGLAPINEAFEIQALFSRDEVFSPDSDYTFLEYIYDGGFGAVGSGANVRNISPDNADFRQNIVSEGYIGERLFFGVFADSDNVIEELFENNNSVFLFNNDLILSEFTLQDALDLSDARVAELNITFTNDQQAPYDSSNVPWVGQSSVNFDAFDAASNVIVGDGETSKFSVNLEPTVPVRVSFWWKVSSENNVDEGQRDFLGFYVDPGASPINFDNADRRIFGTDEEDWRRVEVVLDPGSHTLTWAYVKDAQGSAGSDRGWVDQLTITELPNLTVTGVSADGSSSYQAGDTINTWSVDIVNTGEAIEPGTAFDIEVRLLPDADWAETGAITLLSITDDTGIGEGETRSYSNLTIGSYTSSPATVGPITLPTVEYPLEYYFFGAYVDWLVADPGSGQVSESDETEVDNSKFTDEASIQIGRPDLVAASDPIDSDIPIDLIDFPYTFGGFPVTMDITLSNAGDGTLAALSSFDYRVYITRTDEEGDLDASSTKLLDSGTKVVLSDIVGGDDLTEIDVSEPLPFGLANGSYFIAVEIDTSDDILEQGLAPDGTGVDGEANNVFFSSSAILDVDGISLYEALEDGTSTIAFEDGDVAVPAAPTPYINQSLDSTSLWFGRDNTGDGTAENAETFTGGDGAQSPELQAGEFAEFSLTVPESSLVRFDWRVFSASDLNVLSVSVNDVEIASISGDVALTEIDPAILVPKDGVVTWRYTKNANTVDDFAYVDNLRIEDNDAPDLVLTDLNYTPGEYILDIAGIAGAPDQLLGTEYLDITIEATNIGETIPSAGFTAADIEVRLSNDRIYGDADDIVLGTVSQVEGDLSSGGQLRFIGPIQLGDSIPEGFYHVMARIDRNDALSEFNESNNEFISLERDVQITRLPALRLFNPDAFNTDELLDTQNSYVYIDPREDRDLDGDTDEDEVAFDIDESLNYYTNGPMRLRFSIQNIGLDRIDPTQAVPVRISLVGALNDDLASAASSGNIFAFRDSFNVAIALREFNITELMEGRSEILDTGRIIDVDLELAIPGAARMNDVIAPNSSLESYLWMIQVDIDPDGTVPQSEIIRESPALILPPEFSWRVMDALEAMGSNLSARNTDEDDGLFGISYEPERVDAGFWESLYDDPTTELEENPFPVSTPENLLAYAFNRNPSDDDTLGGQFPGTYGLTEYEEGFYLYQSFDIVTRAEDLEYVVQASDDPLFAPGSTDTLVTIRPPYTNSVGISSLTGDGGLIDEGNVLSVLDQGYSARITVRDNLVNPMPTSRFMRVLVNLVELTNRIDELFVVPEMVLLGVPENDPNILGSSDYDGDGVNNFLELMNNTDPTNPGAEPVPALTAEDEFVANQLGANDVFGVGAALSGDFDGDGIDDLVEIIAGSNPGDSESVPAAEENFVAEELADRGVLSIINTSPGEDFDSDGVSNLVELLYGFDPTDSGATPTLTAEEVFVAQEMSSLGAFGLGIANIGPDDDFDLDTISNVVELLSGTDPTDATDAVALSALEQFVTDQLGFNGAFVLNAPNLAPREDYDGDGISNIAELQYGRDPVDATDVPALSFLEERVAEDFAELYDTYGAPVSPGPGGGIGPFEDYDNDGDINIDEINDGTDPTI